MKVTLPHGLATIIDDADATKLRGFNWRAKRDKHTHYVMAQWWESGTKHTVLLHRVLMELQAGDHRQVDHVNGDGLDNRRSNLRIATNQQNCFNQRLKPNISGFKGVTWHAPTSQWRARISTISNRIHLGLFPTAQTAHAAYCEAAKKYHGEFARTS